MQGMRVAGLQIMERVRGGSWSHWAASVQFKGLKLAARRISSRGVDDGHDRA
jgi:hypothetical protein